MKMGKTNLNKGTRILIKKGEHKGEDQRNLKTEYIYAFNNIHNKSIFTTYPFHNLYEL